MRKTKQKKHNQATTKPLRKHFGPQYNKRKRTNNDKDGLMWFSDTANELLYEEYFHLTNIEKDFLPVFKRFYSDEKLRTCPKTGEVMEADSRYISD